MRKNKEKFEYLANILIVSVAILLIGVIAKNYYFDSSTVPAPKSPLIGNKLSVADVNFSISNKNIVLVLQKGCRFCTASAEFYKKLIQVCKSSGVNVIAVLPQDRGDAEDYLQSLGISGIEIRQAELSTMEIGGTPTLLITNSKGEISNVWVGQLESDRELEVLNHLTQ